MPCIIISFFVSLPVFNYFQLSPTNPLHLSVNILFRKVGLTRQGHPKEAGYKAPIMYPKKELEKGKK